jgi:hypothetical protein
VPSGGQRPTIKEDEVDEQRDKIKDLEVKEDEARDIAGGKKIAAKSRGAKSPGKKATGRIRYGKNES